MKKNITLFILLFVSLLFIRSGIDVKAATQINDYVKVEYGNTSSVTSGTVRYVSQLPGTQYFYSDYWGSLVDSASWQCQLAAASMALSYVNVDYLPKDMGLYWGPGQNVPPAEYTTPSDVSSAIDIMYNNNGKYSPLVAHIQPSWTSGGEHWVTIVGRKSGNTYQVLDPGNSNGYYETTIEGNTFYRNGSGYPIDFRVQYYNPNSIIDTITVHQTSSTSIRAEWEEYEGAHQYFIEVLDSSGNRVKGIWTSYLGWDFNNLTAGATYTVRLDILDSSGSSMGETSKTITLQKYEPVLSDGVYHIVSKLNSDYGINVAYHSVDSGANIQMYNEMGETDVYSLVKVTYLDMGCYTLEMMNSGKVLDCKDGGTTNKTNVWQYDYNGTDAQKWIIQETGDGWFYIVSKLSGLYMEVAGGYLENYSNVQLYEGNQTNAQKWRFIASGLSTGKTVEDGEYHILSGVNSEYGMEIYVASQDDYANCDIYESSENDNQIFTLTYLGNGYYSIIAKHSGKALEAQGGGTKKYTKVTQFSWNSSDAQKWIIRQCSDGYEIINKASGLYLDLSGGIAVNETNVQLYVGNGTKAQAWLLNEHRWEIQGYEFDEISTTLIANYECVSNHNHTKTETLEDVNALILPAQLKEIEAQAFEGSSCQVVIIPDGCTKIGSRAFANCKNLLYVEIPESVTEIAEDVFDGCTNLQLFEN